MKTSQRQTSMNGEERLTSSPEAFPASLFPMPENGGGREDERYLWPQMFRAIDEIRPTWVVGENVAGITTMVEGGVLTPMGCDSTLFGEGDGLHRYELRQSFTIERICRDLESLGYTVQPMLIPAAAVGAPHRRYRVFFLAHVTDSESLQFDGQLSEYRGEYPGKEMQQFGNGYREDDVADPKGGCSQASELVKSEDNIQRERESGRSNRKNAPNTNSQGLQESKQSGREENPEKAEERLDNRAERSGNNGDVAYSFRKRLETAIQRGCDDSQGRDGERRYAFISSYDAWVEGTWWKFYPSISPVHSGNDGIPIRMDGASIPFTKWRTEALKAYGNAIVPQVMYRIFQAIENNS